MSIEINIYEAIYPAILKRFKIEMDIIQNIYVRAFDKEYQKTIDDLDQLVEDIITDKLDTNVLSTHELNSIIGKTNYDYRLSNRFNDFLGYFTVNSLYSSYEKYLRDVVLLPQHMDEKEYKRMNYISNLKPFLKKKYGLDYDTLPFTKEIEELRCLNNSIKHDRMVNEELSVINPAKWVLGQEIGNVYDDFQRLKNAPLNILDYLTKEVKFIIENNPN